MMIIGIEDVYLRNLLNSRHQANQHVTELQERGTELLLENRALKRSLAELACKLKKLRGEQKAHGRWLVLKTTSPSGKTLFCCRVCGRTSPTPDKSCKGYYVYTLKPEIHKDCADWKPETIE